METLKLKMESISQGLGLPLFFSVGTIIWIVFPLSLHNAPNFAFADIGIWHLIVLAVLLWLLSQSLVSYLITQLLASLGLPQPKILIKQFNALTLWQKYILYYATFSLSLLALLASLLALL